MALVSVSDDKMQMTILIQRLTFQTFQKLSKLSGNFIFYKDFQENLIT